jgi:uncharacterized membrane protein
MKDSIGLVVALLFAGWGASALMFPQWFYRTVTPEQVSRDRKRFRILGFILLPLGVILLVLHFIVP